MSYLSKLRAEVGSRPLLLSAVALLVVNEGELLLQKRTDNNLWGLPGGYMEPGETPEQSAERELFEETSLRPASPDDLTLLGVVAGEESFYRYPNGDEVYIVSIVYRVDNTTGTPEIRDDEGSALAYMPLGDLPDATLMMPPNLPILERFLDTLRQNA